MGTLPLWHSGNASHSYLFECDGHEKLPRSIRGGGNFYFLISYGTVSHQYLLNAMDMTRAVVRFGMRVQ